MWATQKSPFLFNKEKKKIFLIYFTLVPTDGSMEATGQLFRETFATGMNPAVVMKLVAVATKSGFQVKLVETLRFWSRTKDLCL